MRTSRSFITLTAIALIGCAAVAAVVSSNWHLYGSPGQIELNLRNETPLGSSEEEVIRYLRREAMRFEQPWRGAIKPNTVYPPNTIAGSSYIRAVVGEYTVVFVTSVEAFYIFDANRRLVEIAVRKTTDGL